MQNKVFITRSILPDGPDLLRSVGFTVDINELDRPLTGEELDELASHYNALITMLHDKIDETFLKKHAHLKVISNYAVGFNNIDVLTATSLKIAIGNTPDVLTEATAELALGLLLAGSRQFIPAMNYASTGLWKNWHPTDLLGYQLKGKTLGIVGMGRIGERLAEICINAFQMNVLYISNNSTSALRNTKKTSLENLLIESDFISIHTPLNESTRNMIGKKQFSLMKKNAILVNTARGEIINQDDLIKALSENLFFCAALDVTTPEPLPINSPLYQLKNVIILPHIGSATYEARQAMSLLAAKNIISGLKGIEFEACVNKIVFQ